MNNLPSLLIGLFFFISGVFLIFNEYSFRSNASVAIGKHVGFDKKDGHSSEDGVSLSFHQKVVFICPFTFVERIATSAIGSSQQPRYLSEVQIRVYVDNKPPHRYRVGSPNYLVGGCLLAMGLVWLIATYAR